jgi:hypothetical protein
LEEPHEVAGMHYNEGNGYVDDIHGYDLPTNNDPWMIGIMVLMLPVLLVL